MKHYLNSTRILRSTSLKLLPLLFTFSSAGELLAMSQSPEKEDEQYKAAAWHHQADAATDAQNAIDNQDLRLLAFATRITIVPGIDREQLAFYREHCGLRFMKGFGDVVRSDKHLENMKQARAYALSYNQKISEHCTSTK